MTQTELESFCAGVLNRAIWEAEPADQLEPSAARSLADVVAEILATLPLRLVGALDGANVPAEVRQILLRIVVQHIRDPDQPEETP